ncbi:MAG TPA: hypothetical protein GXX57_05005 [Firmicutes bacterium]|nr:hypothetical protein [Bacillota bacterium]
MTRLRCAVVLALIVLLFIGCTTTSFAYSISGTITDNKGRPIAGVVVVTDEDPPKIAVTDVWGRWTITGLTGIVRVTASKPGRIFIPASQLVTGPTNRLDWTQSLTPIVGEAVATREQARAWLDHRAPGWGWLADLYYDIAPEYGIRPDVALAQAVKETGAFRFDGIVQAWQNNFCGLGATGTPSDGNTPLNGADPTQVRFQAGICGAIFTSAAAGVEAHIQHLYAYATTKALPVDKVLLSPRFVYVKRGTAPFVEYLGARENPSGSGWAYPGHTYGATLVWNYIEDLISFPY